MNRSMSKEMNALFSFLIDENYTIEEATKGALTQARRKLKPEGFIELSDLSVASFYENEEYKKWNNYRLLAIDGSTINLPTHSSLEANFPIINVGRNADVPRHMARISLLHDVLNCITLDAQIGSFKTDERTLMHNHLNRVELQKDDLLLVDRGYCSIALMYSLIKEGTHFCMRMKDNWWKVVQEFQEEDCLSKIVSIELPKKDLYLKNAYNSQDSSVKVRLVKIKLSTGESEILATSLLEEEKYSLENLKELYHLRWAIEETYKTLKTKLCLEVFSGKTEIAVKQDFYAKIFMMNMCSIMAFPVKERLDRDKHKSKHKRQINTSNAISFVRDNWYKLIFNKKIEWIINKLDTFLLKTTEIIRLNRSNARKKTPKKPPAMSYKSI
jgi:hypothetical protein